jgi:hypothetical protein
VNLPEAQENLPAGGGQVLAAGPPSGTCLRH